MTTRVAKSGNALEVIGGTCVRKTLVIDCELGDHNSKSSQFQYSFK